MSMTARRLYLLLRIVAFIGLSVVFSPPSDCLTPHGQTLCYRVIKTLKVLEDVLANKIPDLQDLKDAKGDTSPITTTLAVAKSD
jgi:hypothetical protein